MLVGPKRISCLPYERAMEFGENITAEIEALQGEMRDSVVADSRR